MNRRKKRKNSGQDTPLLQQSKATNGWGPWIVDQCMKRGTCKLTKQQFETVFQGPPEKSRVVLDRFRSQGRLSLTVSKESQEFVFELDEHASRYEDDPG